MTIASLKQSMVKNILSPKVQCKFTSVHTTDQTSYSVSHVDRDIRKKINELRK